VELRGKLVATITEWLASLGVSERAQRFAGNRIDDVASCTIIGVPPGIAAKFFARLLISAPPRRSNAIRICPRGKAAGRR